MTVNVNAPRDRGTAFAWFNLTDDLGKGLGPVLSAWLIGKMGRKSVQGRVLVLAPCGAARRGAASCELTRGRGGTGGDGRARGGGTRTCDRRATPDGKMENENRSTTTRFIRKNGRVSLVQSSR